MKKMFLFIALFLFIAPVVSAEMPSDVLNVVKAKIAKKYPDNYSLQKTLIDGQKESYDFLGNYYPEDIPDDVLDRIKEKYARKYPLNFSLQKTLIEGQVKSYRELQN